MNQDEHSNPVQAEETPEVVLAPIAMEGEKLIPPVESRRALVNPVSVQHCLVKWGELSSRVLDISYVRLVVEEVEGWPAIVEGQLLNLDFFLGGYQFSAGLTVQGRGENWIRFKFEKIVPSARSQLRSFLSPKKIGESISQDSRSNEIWHFHGLNESELWFDQLGAVLFTYLDQSEPAYQFVVQITDAKSVLRAGRIHREDYMKLPSIEVPLELMPMGDRENYSRMSECRDIVTNFRPQGEAQYHLKQRLLKAISESLYSTSHRVNMIAPRSSRNSGANLDG